MKSDKESSNSSDDDRIVEEIRRKLAQNDGAKSEAPKVPRSIDWRDPNEVKSYLDNLYVEYSFQCISEKRPDGCHRLANFLENVRREFKESTDLYKKNCDEYKYARSCYTYAKNRMLGRGCSKNLIESCNYNFMACSAGLIEGCLNAGICLADGVGGWPQNVQESLKYLERVCDEKHPMGCLRLFKIYIDGQGDVKKDGPKAFEYTKRACEYGDILGCLNASRMLRLGDGVPKDPVLSEEFRKKAEELNKQIESHRGSNTPIVFGEQHK